jgi:(1->4)-alpha-D-glucan 1-alpha-D-glucosylmutase
MGPLLATYRLQLHAGFPLHRVRLLVPYLHRLGVTHLYLSPILRARRGSTHGYDVVDPARLDPALGTEAELRGLVRALRRRRMGLVLDIVPNHMAADADNPYWDDVLAHGRGSPYAGWFDLDWGAPGQAGRDRVFLPVLGDQLPRVLARGQIRLAVQAGQLRVRYFDQSFPVDPATLTPLRRPQESLHRTARRLAHGRALRDLLDAQHYRLAYWRRAAREINYRRFFTVSHLVAVRVEEPAVFRATHALVLRWAADGLLDGLRIDHIDGLLDPLEYLQRLTRASGVPRSLHVVVEKILAPDERLPARWPVAGTTGYEFLNSVENLLLDPTGTIAIERFYRDLTGRAGPFAAVALRAKRFVLDHHLAADLWRLTRLLLRALPHSRRRLGFARLALAVREVIVHLSVYRTYLDRRHAIPSADRVRLRRAIAGARRSRHADPRAVDAVATALLRSRLPRDPARLEFVMRFQQLCPPVAAKGVEDTALYRYAPLVPRNEVGADPGASLAGARAALHRSNGERARHRPGTLLCADTHDTKRSADVRARLDVLSERPALWAARVRRWHGLNAPLRGTLDAATEYLFYQSLVALWPIGHLAGRRSSRPEWSVLRARLRAYMRKAVREAKVRTSWVRPDARYEATVDRFVRGALARGHSRAFLLDVGRFTARLARAGMWNAVARTLVQCTAPGVPDIYQGDELWSLCLVDPDNRMPVDFARRRRMLAGIERRFAAGGAVRRMLLTDLLRRPEDGRVKLHVIRRALVTRSRFPNLFLLGTYHPLRVIGPRAAHLFAFARRDPTGTAITVVPRLVARLGGPDDREAPVGRVWAGSMVRLPFRLDRMMTDALTGRRVAPRRDARGDYLPVEVLFRDLPGALLTTRRRSQNRTP